MELEECRKCPCYENEIDAGTLRCSFWNKIDLRLIVKKEGAPPRVEICPLLAEKRDHHPSPLHAGFGESRAFDRRRHRRALVTA